MYILDDKFLDDKILIKIINQMADKIIKNKNGDFFLRIKSYINKDFQEKGKKKALQWEISKVVHL